MKSKFAWPPPKIVNISPHARSVWVLVIDFVCLYCFERRPDHFLVSDEEEEEEVRKRGVGVRGAAGRVLLLLWRRKTLFRRCHPSSLSFFVYTQKKKNSNNNTIQYNGHMCVQRARAKYVWIEGSVRLLVDEMLCLLAIYCRSVDLFFFLFWQPSHTHFRYLKSEVEPNLIDWILTSPFRYQS